MNPELKDKFISNLVALPKMNSAKFMALCGFLAMVWVGLPADQQATVIAHLPLPAWALPIIATIIGLAVRVWPQVSLTPPVTVVTDGVPAADPVPPQALPVLTEAVEAPAASVSPDDKYLTAMKILYPDITDVALARVGRLASKLAENAASAAAKSASAGALTATLRDRFNVEAAP